MRGEGGLLSTLRPFPPSRRTISTARSKPRIGRAIFLYRGATGTNPCRVITSAALFGSGGQPAAISSLISLKYGAPKTPGVITTNTFAVSSNGFSNACTIPRGTKIVSPAPASTVCPSRIILSLPAMHRLIERHMIVRDRHCTTRRYLHLKHRQRRPTPFAVNQHSQQNLRQLDLFHLHNSICHPVLLASLISLAAQAPYHRR